MADVPSCPQSPARRFPARFGTHSRCSSEGAGVEVRAHPALSPQRCPLDRPSAPDCNRPATRGWRTAVDADETLAHSSVHITRERVYATARCRMR